jgi:hypothetical protein
MAAHTAAGKGISPDRGAWRSGRSTGADRRPLADSASWRLGGASGNAADAPLGSDDCWGTGDTRPGRGSRGLARDRAVYPRGGRADRRRGRPGEARAAPAVGRGTANERPLDAGGAARAEANQLVAGQGGYFAQALAGLSARAHRPTDPQRPKRSRRRRRGGCAPDARLGQETASRAACCQAYARPGLGRVAASRAQVAWGHARSSARR